jgi:hypothetical protein
MKDMNCYTCSVVIHFGKFGIRFFVLEFLIDIWYAVAWLFSVSLAESMRTLRNYWNSGHDYALFSAEFNVNSTNGR